MSIKNNIIEYIKKRMNKGFEEMKLEDRKLQVEKLKVKNPTMVPVILKIDPNSTIPHLDKKR